MAKIMPYTDDRGMTHPVSYWNVSFVSLQPRTKTGNITFNGYANRDIRLDGNYKPVGSKSYTVEPDRYDTYFSIEAQSGKNVEQLCYIYAAETYDQPVPATEEGGSPKSFFSDAIDDL